MENAGQIFGGARGLEVREFAFEQTS